MDKNLFVDFVHFFKDIKEELLSNRQYFVTKNKNKNKYLLKILSIFILTNRIFLIRYKILMFQIYWNMLKPRVEYINLYNNSVYNIKLAIDNLII